MQKLNRGYLVPALVLVIALVLGQAAAFLISPGSYQTYLGRLPAILSMIAFWTPVVALVAGVIIWAILRLMGFTSLEQLRQESVEQNNPVPAIIFTGALIASILLLSIVIRP
jgi:hypothetical protein